MILTNQITTAYCICSLCCHPKWGGITASGVRPVQGITIAGPRKFPFGTKIKIDNKTFLLQDRVSWKYEGRWDVFFNKHKDAVKFGKKTNTVEVLR